MDIEKPIINSITNQIFKENKIYLLPQIALLILIYFLMMNAIYLKILFIVPDLNKIIPKVIKRYNEQMLINLDNWMPFLTLLGLLLIASAFCISIIRFLPLIQGYKIFYHSEIGFYNGKWLILAGCVYYVFKLNSTVYIFLFIIVYSIVFLIDKLKIKKWLSSKGIEFQ